MDAGCHGRCNLNVQGEGAHGRGGQAGKDLAVFKTEEELIKKETEEGGHSEQSKNHECKPRGKREKGPFGGL